MVYQGMEEDRKLILASADELEQYLASSVILWPLHGKLPPISPGNLLFSILRLDAKSNDPGLSDVVAKVETFIETNRAAWRRHVEKEIPMRLSQYRSLVDDYLDLGSIDAGYRRNISARVKLDLLFSALNESPALELRKVTELDRRLFSLVQEGEFIWEAVLRDRFPKDRYNYLYVEAR